MMHDRGYASEYRLWWKSARCVAAISMRLQKLERKDSGCSIFFYLTRCGENGFNPQEHVYSYRKEKHSSEYCPSKTLPLPIFRTAFPHSESHCCPEAFHKKVYFPVPSWKLERCSARSCGRSVGSGHDPRSKEHRKDFLQKCRKF